MMKKVRILLLALAALLCFSGCDVAHQEAAAAQILRVKVEYDVEQAHRIVKIDLSDGTKTVTDYFGDSSEETVGTLEEAEALRAYLTQTVIPHFPETSGTSTEEQVRWRIQITRGGENLVAYGIGEDAFPPYWAELLALLQE